MRSFALLLAVLLSAHAAADTLKVGRVERSYVAQLPSLRPAPLVIVLHGSGEQGNEVREHTTWPEIARREQFAVVFPNGLNRAWADLRSAEDRPLARPPAGTDDVAFIDALIDKLVRDGVADPKRIYITGMSNGGAMTMTLACRHPGKFAAAASVAMSLTESMAAACQPLQPIPMLLMNGTADPLLAYDGGRGTGHAAVSGLLSTPDTLLFWRRVNGCDVHDAAVTDLPGRGPGDRTTVTRIDSHCPADADAVLYRINGGGHRMPGLESDARMKAPADRALGPQNHDIDGAQTIWEFFKRFARP